MIEQLAILTPKQQTNSRKKKKKTNPQHKDTNQISILHDMLQSQIEEKEKKRREEKRREEKRYIVVMKQTYLLARFCAFYKLQLVP